MEVEWIESARKRGLEAQWRLADLTPGQRVTLERMDRYWMRQGFALSTRRHYVAQARSLAKSLCGKDFEAATRQDLEAYLDQVAGRLSWEGLRAAMTFLKAFYKVLLQPDSLGHPPLVSWIRIRRPAREHRLPMDLLSPADVRLMAQRAGHPRDRAAILVLYESAARASELLALRVGDVHFDAYGARLMLRGKTGTRPVRLITTVPDLQAWLESHPFKDDPNRPLWVSWDHSKFHEPLTSSGLAVLLRRSADAAGLKKRVHPHLFRHSRLTELAKQLSESELKVFAGWTADSAMAKVYIHLSGDDVDRKILEKAGLLHRGEVNEAPTLEARKCPRCEAANSAASAYCSTCTMPLDEAKAMRLAEEQRRLVERLPRLLQLLEKPEVAVLLGKLAREESCPVNR